MAAKVVRPLGPPDPPRPRLRDDSLPPRRYVPGGSAHPKGLYPELTFAPWVEGAAWWEDEAWIAGLDRFDQGYLWESHELWEAGWHQASGDRAERLQGMIQAAAAALTLHLGRPEIAAGLAERAAGRLLPLVGREEVGVDLSAFVAGLRAHLDGGPLPATGVVLPERPARRRLHVVGAAMIEDGRVLVCRRAPHVRRGGYWELPGGKVEAGESEGDAIVRELREELGVEVEVVRRLGACDHDYPEIGIRLVAWQVRRVAGEPAGTDHDALRWVTEDALDTLDWAPADLPLVDAVRAALRA